MRPYAQVYANPERSSRVSAPKVIPLRIERFATFPSKPAVSYPRFVLPSRRADHALTALDEISPIVLGRSDARVASSSTLRSLVIGEDGFDDGRAQRSWDTPLGPGERGIDAFATWIGGQRRMRIDQGPSGEQGPETGALVAWDGDKVWTRRFEGETLGALSGTVGAVVVEEQASTLHLFALPFDGQPDAWSPRWSEPFVGGTGKRGGVYEVSLLEDGIALVVDTMPRGGMGGPLRRSQDRPTWSSAVVVFDLDGHQRYRLDLSWSVAMPVIDAGTGRIVVAGSMLVAYQDGKELWRREGGPVRATAYDDGALVITQGEELIAITRDGAELGRVRATDDQPFTTPPAIAADGSIWAATSKGIWVARGAP